MGRRPGATPLPLLILPILHASLLPRLPPPLPLLILPILNICFDIVQNVPLLNRDLAHIQRYGVK